MVKKLIKNFFQGSKLILDYFYISMDKVESKEEKYDRLIFNSLINKIKKKILLEIENRIEEIQMWKCKIYINRVYIGSIYYEQAKNEDLEKLIDFIPKDKFKEAICENVEKTELAVNIIEYGRKLIIEL